MTAVETVLDFEGGLTLDPNDDGNWTGGHQGRGELNGTKWGISAASYPHLNIRALTRDVAVGIYHDDYWLRCDCHLLPWPLSLVVFDTAVNAGVGVALELLAETDDPEEYIALRFERYTSFLRWPQYGKGWTRRLADLLRHTSGEGASFGLETLVLHLPCVEEPVVYRGRIVAKPRGTKLDVRFVEGED